MNIIQGIIWTINMCKAVARMNASRHSVYQGQLWVVCRDED